MLLIERCNQTGETFNCKIHTQSQQTKMLFTILQRVAKKQTETEVNHHHFNHFSLFKKSPQIGVFAPRGNESVCGR